MHTKSFCFCCMVTTSVIRTVAVYLWVSWLSVSRVSSAQHHIWISDSLLASPFPFHPLHYLPLALGGINTYLKHSGWGGGVGEEIFFVLSFLCKHLLLRYEGTYMFLQQLHETQTRGNFCCWAEFLQLCL